VEVVEELEGGFVEGGVGGHFAASEELVWQTQENELMARYLVQMVGYRIEGWNWAIVAIVALVGVGV